MLVGLMSYSVVGIAGFVDMNISETTGRIRRSIETVADLRSDLARKLAQLQGLGRFEPPSVVDERLNGLKQDRRWQSSKGCTNATVKESRTFCERYHSIEAEKNRGLEAAQLELKIQRVQQAITSLSGVAQLDQDEPRVGILVRVTGWASLTIQTGLTLLLVGIIECMSTFGVFLSLNHGELRRGAARQTWPRRAQSRKKIERAPSVM